MSSLKLIAVRHGAVQKSMVFYTGMQPGELRRLLIATFGPPSSSGRLWSDATLALLDPVTGQTIALHEACADAASLPDVVELLVLSASISNATTSAAATASASSSHSTRPILHTAHSHRMQPYPQPHHRQPSQQQQQEIAYLQQQLQLQQLQQSHRPASPNSPLSPPPFPSFPPPFVLTLQSAADVLQALQLSEHLIVLLFIHLSSSSSTPLYQLYHQLASSARYPHLLFLSVEHSLLAATAPSVPSLSLPPPPSLQLYYAGTPIGQVVNVNEEQMITLVSSSQELVSQLQSAQPTSPTLSNRRVRWEEGEEDEGVLLSTDEAVALESLVLRESPAVVAAYQAFPSLSLVVDAFMRIARHIGQEKQKRRADASASAYEQLLSGALQGLQQGGLIDAEDEKNVRTVYEAGGGGVYEALERYAREGNEEKLMEGLWVIAMEQKREQAPREWEGRDDSEGMRARRAAQRAKRGKWTTPPVQPKQTQPEEEEEEEEADDEEDEEEEEEEEEEDELDDEEDEDAEDEDEEDSQEELTPNSSQSPPTSFSPSSALYSSSINTLATLSASAAISPPELSFYIHLLTSSHPLILAAFESFHSTNDLADLLDTLRRIRQKALSLPPATATSAGMSAADMAALLSMLPAEFIEGHGDAIDRLTAQRDGILLGALQIWKQAMDGGKRGDGNDNEADLQQLLSIVMKRIDKHKRDMDQAKPTKREKQPAETAAALKGVRAGSGEEDAERKSASSALNAPTASTGRPRSPQSPQVSLEQIQALKKAYRTGVEVAHNAQQTLAGALAALVASGAISEEERQWTEARWRDGDARLLGVLQVHEADADEEELKDSLRRLAKQGGQSESSSKQEGKDDERKADAATRSEPTVTVEDVTADADTPRAGSDNKEAAAN